jgi:hypothetical protein
MNGVHELVLVPGRLFQSILMFVGEGQEPTLKCSTRKVQKSFIKLAQGSRYPQGGPPQPETG